MFPKTVLPLLLLCSVAFGAHYSPVLLFGGSGETLPALSLVSSEKFASIAQDEDAMKVIFVSNVKNEDFLDCATESGETCFTGLKSIKDKTYYRHVDSPIQTIKKSAGKWEVLRTNTEGKLDASSIVYNPKSSYIVHLSGSAQSQDALITEFLAANKDNKIVALYVPKAGQSRKTRAAPATGKVFYSAKPGFVFYFEKMQLCTIADKKPPCEEIDLSASTMTTPESNASSFSVSFNTPKTLGFNVAKDNSGYFEVSNLKYGDTTFRVLPAVQAPVTFSYFCGDKTFYQYGGSEGVNPYSLVFTNLQIQAPFSEGDLNKETFAFGDPWHCVPFVSIPILAGLFVSAILLAILGVGICWLMDINTMDRFDDPKGKTITINANE